MRDIVREAFFAETTGGARFCLLTRPYGPPKGGLLFVPPFAEEMNKARRMVTVAVQAFAAQGWAVLQLDLKGCGDSAGDFGDVAWADWVADVAFGWRLLRERLGVDATMAVWTLRGGSLLVADWLAAEAVVPPCLMWQPVSNGKQHLTQFLRLKAASEMLSDSDARTVMARLRSELAQSQPVEVAGYTIAPALAIGLDACLLRFPVAYAGPLKIIEVSMAEPQSTSPAIALAIDKWREGGVDVRSHAVQGPAFWQTQEIELAPAAIEPSAQFLRDLA